MLKELTACITRLDFIGIFILLIPYVNAVMYVSIEIAEIINMISVANVNVVNIGCLLALRTLFIVFRLISPCAKKRSPKNKKCDFSYLHDENIMI